MTCLLKKLKTNFTCLFNQICRFCRASLCNEQYISIIGTKQDVSMAVPALIPPKAKLMLSSQEETWLATVSSSIFFFNLFIFFNAKQ